VVASLLVVLLAMAAPASAGTQDAARLIRTLGRAHLAEAAHYVAIDPTTQHVLFPVESEHGHPALRVMEPLRSDGTWRDDLANRAWLTITAPIREWRAPTRLRTLKSLLTKTWCGQLTPIMWTLYSPLLSSTTRLTVPPG